MYVYIHVVIRNDYVCLTLLQAVSHGAFKCWDTKGPSQFLSAGGSRTPIDFIFFVLCTLNVDYQRD